jgi:pimeloyl-ACP methyl ester carboxylesterase
MPTVSHRGQRIHYTVEGSGPLVVLQHGILLDAESWKRAGFVDELTDEFRVACIDSLGHGHSDKPADPRLYIQQQRTGDIVAVLDDLNCARAHLVGHSMGGWLGVGMAKHHPQRLLSLVLGGWDPVNGLPPGPKGPLSFDVFMKFARRTAPALTGWIAPEYEGGLRACFDALADLDGAQAAIRAAGVPVMIWEGRADPFHDARKASATANGWRFLSTAGDHLGMLLVHGDESAKGVRAFLETSG